MISPELTSGLFWTIFVLSTIATAFSIAIIALRARSGSQKSKFVGNYVPPLVGVGLAVSFAVWVLSLAGGIEAAKANDELHHA
jgi:hypothetical protein